MENSEFKKALSDEIIVGYHKQFADTQNLREQAFLKIVSLLGAVIFGYAYVYHFMPNDNSSLAFIAIASQILLVFGASIVVMIAYNFRKEQYIIARIRKLLDLIGPDKPFPKDYDPKVIFDRRVSQILWLPDIFSVYFLIFPSFQLLILITFIFKIDKMIINRAVSLMDFLTVIISTFCIFLSFFMFLLYGYRLRKRISKWVLEFEKETD